MTKALETPAGWYSDGSGGERYWDGSAWTASRSAEDVATVAELERRRTLLIRWFTVCTALLVALTVAVIYTLVSQAGGRDIAVSAPSPAGPAVAPQAAPTPDLAAPHGEWVDGPFAFRVDEIEVGTTVSSTEEPAEKTAIGQYIVVRLAVVNIGGATAHFHGTLQTLHAGGTAYAIDDEASLYVNGGYVEIPPGAEAHVGVAYDVPPATVPEILALRADPASPGVKIRLS